MKIRKTQEKDIKNVVDLYQKARDFMRKSGNPNQWQDGYPSEESLRDDMKKGVSYVIEDEGSIVGTFAFIIGEDTFYSHIENGAWRKDEPYGVIHRIASSGQVRNFTKICLDFCLEQIPYLRIDTHEDNIPMKRAIKRYGFKECGLVYVRDKSPRRAFDYY